MNICVSLSLGKWGDVTLPPSGCYPKKGILFSSGCRIPHLPLSHQATACVISDPGGRDGWPPKSLPQVKLRLCESPALVCSQQYEQMFKYNLAWYLLYFSEVWIFPWTIWLASFIGGCWGWRSSGISKHYQLVAQKWDMEQVTSCLPLLKKGRK